MDPVLDFAVCRLCGRLVSLCSRCRNRATCSSACAKEHRRRQVREAGRRHQRTPEGAADHADRQRRYRERRRRLVTHQDGQNRGTMIEPPAPAEFAAAPASPEVDRSQVPQKGARTTEVIPLSVCAFCRRVTSQWHRLWPGVRARRPSASGKRRKPHCTPKQVPY